MVAQRISGSTPLTLLTVTEADAHPGAGAGERRGDRGPPTDWQGKAGPIAIPGPLELGDIVISVETATRQAAQHGHSLERELLSLQRMCGQLFQLGETLHHRQISDSETHCHSCNNEVT